ncbi:MAG TPA: M20/M25/M40 family metallo-hydrolase [Holophagaceae bacterium]|nr:M20/M25/M40 family metallo-hydrolase [Holophagaceae bacterium]
MRALLAALAASAALLPAQAPDAARMRADVFTLASPAFEGRLTGAPGQMKAARLVAARFKELGLQPLGKGAEPYFLPYALEHLTATMEGSHLSLNGRRAPYGAGAVSTLMKSVKAPLIFEPDGAKPGPEAAGCWIAAFVPAGSTGDQSDHLYFAALAAHASGLLLLPRPGGDLGGFYKEGQRFIERGRWVPGGQPVAAGPAMAGVDAAAAAALGLDLEALAKRTALQRLGTWSVEPRTSLQTEHPVNVAALLPGSDPLLKDEIVVLSAHEDHLGIFHGQLHPGADDNASGTAVLMEAARLLKDAKPRRSILFLSLSGEELGLYGSRAFVADPPVPLKSIVADLNADMVGRNGVKTIAVTPARVPDATGTLTRDAREIAGGLGFTLTDEADAYWKRSDHYTFVQAGIPAIFFFGGMEADYHQATDTPDKIEPEKLVNVAELLRRLALRTANAEARPKALPGTAWEGWKWPSR